MGAEMSQNVWNKLDLSWFEILSTLEYIWVLISRPFQAAEISVARVALILRIPSSTAAAMPTHVKEHTPAEEVSCPFEESEAFMLELLVDQIDNMSVTMKLETLMS